MFNPDQYPKTNSIESPRADTDARQAWGYQTSLAEVARDIINEQKALKGALQQDAFRRRGQKEQGEHRP